MMPPEFKAECLAMAKNVELAHVFEFIYDSARFDALAEAFRDVADAPQTTAVRQLIRSQIHEN